MGRNLRKYLLLAFLLVGISSKASAVTWDSIPDDKKKNGEAAWAAAIKAGFSEASAAALLGNAWAESSWDPFLQQYGGPAWGFYQMESERQANLKAFMSKEGAMSDPVKGAASATRFLISELEQANMFATYGLDGGGDGRYVGPRGEFPTTPVFRYDVLKYVKGNGKSISTSVEEFKKNTDVDKATVEFLVSYERAYPSDSTLHLDNRLETARSVYEALSGKKVEGAPEGDGGGNNGQETYSNTSSAMVGAGRKWEYNEKMIPNLPSDRDYDDSETTMDKITQAGESLTDEDKIGIAKWVQERNQTKESRLISIIRILVIVLGIFCIVYPSVLFLAYVVDLWLVLGDSPVFRFVTFNRLAVDLDTSMTSRWFMDRETNKKLKIKRMAVGDVLLWCTVFSIVGVTLLSGYLYSTFGSVVEFIGDIITLN